MDWLVTPSARALAWSTSRRITLTDSFQLSLTPRMLAFSRITRLDLVGALAQHQRVDADHAELHRVGHRRAVGQQLDAAAHLGKLAAPAAPAA